MTIGALPPRNGSIHAAPAAAKIAPVDATGSRGFAEALRTTALSDLRDQDVGAAPQDHAMLFNQHGFFAKADGIDVANLSMTAPALSDAVLPDVTSGIAMPSPLVPLLSQAHLSGSAEPASVPGASRSVGKATAVPVRAASLWTRASATSAQNLVAVLSASLPARAADGSVIASARASRVRPAQDIAAKNPITVALDVGEGAAAVTVSAHGLTEREVDALHADIVALLRRHGRTIGDIRLNGRPMGQGQDRSGS